MLWLCVQTGADQVGKTSGAYRYLWHCKQKRPCNLRFTACYFVAQCYAEIFRGRFACITQWWAVKYWMKTIYTVLSLSPAVLFFLGFVHSLYSPSYMCGTDHSMSIMWFVMMIAHLTPWLIWWQQRNFTRN